MGNPSILKRYAAGLAFLLGLVLLLGALRLSGPVWASIPDAPESGMEAGRYFPNEALAKGRFLLATDKVRDKDFAHTVILITEHNWHGTTGIIINMPSKKAPSEVLPYIKGIGDVDDVVWFGGPVDNAQITMLIRSKEAPDYSVHLFADVYASSSADTLSAMLAGEEAGRFRLYAGYTGWAPRQLEIEVAQGGWYVMDAWSADIFEDAGADEVWARLVGRVHGR